MIGQLSGTILEKQPPQLLLDVHGVGYEIDVPMSTFYQLPEVGQPVTLLTHFIVREDAQHLYGFYFKEERMLFRTLLKVNGIGPRLGLTILSSIKVDEFIRYVAEDDAEGLIRIPGIGKKTAERLLIEMRDKLSAWHPHSSSDTSSLILPNHSPSRHSIIQDAVSALITLGYKAQEASRAVMAVDDGNRSSEEMIRYALREMMP